MNQQKQNGPDFEKLEIPLVAKLFTIYEYSHKITFSLPKNERYTLGERIERTILETIELVVTANSSNKIEKERYLIRVNSKIETIKIIYLLALNCNLIEHHRYLEASREIAEAGKMTQGWIKYARNLK